MSYTKNPAYYPIYDEHVLAVNLSVFQDVYPINVFTFKQDSFNNSLPLIEATFQGELERQSVLETDDVDVALVNCYRKNLIAVTCKSQVSPLQEGNTLQNYARITNARPECFNLYQELAKQKDNPDYELKLEHLVARNEHFKLGLIVLVDLSGFEFYVDFLKSSIQYQAESLMKYLRFMLQRSRPANLRQIIECQIETIGDVFEQTVGQNEHKLAYFELSFENNALETAEFEGEIDWSRQSQISPTMEFILNNNDQRIVFQPKHCASMRKLPETAAVVEGFRIHAAKVYYTNNSEEVALEIPLFIPESGISKQHVIPLKTLAQSSKIPQRITKGYRTEPFPPSFIGNAISNIEKSKLLDVLFHIQKVSKLFIIGPEAIVNLILRSMAYRLTPYERDRIIFANLDKRCVDCATIIHPLSHYLNPERCPNCGRFKHLSTYVEGGIVGINGFSSAGCIVQSCVLKLDNFAITNLCRQGGIISVFKGQQWEQTSQYLRGLIGGQFYKTAEEVLHDLVREKIGNSHDELRKLFPIPFKPNF